MTRTLRCTVEYAGTAFAGFQRQSDRVTVQQTLEDALGRVTGEPVTVVAAGRTDAGVHALGQVVHFVSTTTLDCATLQRAVNACLPQSVAVRELVDAAPGFHARFDAVSREYRYLVDNGTVRSPLWAQRALFVPGSLEVEPMQRAAALLVGRHDFAAFGAPMAYTRPDAATGRVSTVHGGTRRTMFTATCWRRRHFILFCFIADAFLRHMVRMLVGTLLRIGAGRLPARTVGELLQGTSPVAAGPAVPAHGLYLMQVRYELSVA
jgi:tRNA pseudouridine38-40 synthase